MKITLAEFSVSGLEKYASRENVALETKVSVRIVRRYRPVIDHFPNNFSGGAIIARKNIAPEAFFFFFFFAWT